MVMVQVERTAWACHVVFSWRSKPPGPWFESHRFQKGNSCWRWSRGCCGRGTDSHPPTDQSDHWRKKAQWYWSKPLNSGLLPNPDFNLFPMIRKKKSNFEIKVEEYKQGKVPLPPSTNSKRVQVSFNEEGVLSSPSEALSPKEKDTFKIQVLITTVAPSEGRGLGGAPCSEDAAWRGRFLLYHRRSHWAWGGGKGRPQISYKKEEQHQKH